MRKILGFIVGFVMSAASWAVSSLCFGAFEPFDNSAAFYIGQLLLSLASAYVGIYKSPKCFFKS